ncbi:hypothetical protein GCM10011360_21930 [Primorskyibacter flagellatus]|uniref:VPLPA-CTERM protein sorting domain-containing protein n=1 Tax=Primorskyibacter flagellatus TaxID=1387277 RepID=A0A917A7T6_9RHOB|nr:VPLPA-CTERM sorting domain-containing protein [Primorskyibacter flagellatus]GGE33712.1 hypothetical protein GCM10011360_21930 [Primorskyibacter flagellatus]
MKRIAPAALAALLLTSAAANALTVTSGSGSAVLSISAKATFDAVPDSVLSYSEAGLTFVNPTTTRVLGGFDAFGFGVQADLLYAGGNQGFLSVTGGTFTAVEFMFGDGNVGYGVPRAGGHTLSNLVYELRLGGSVIGSGIVNGRVGDVVGFADAGGFDEIRLAAGPGIGAFGNFQSIAIDDFTVGSMSAVPLPASALLLLGALAGLAARRRRV